MTGAGEPLDRRGLEALFEAAGVRSSRPWGPDRMLRHPEQLARDVEAYDQALARRLGIDPDLALVMTAATPRLDADRFLRRCPDDLTFVYRTGLGPRAAPNEAAMAAHPVYGRACRLSDVEVEVISPRAQLAAR